MTPISRLAAVLVLAGLAVPGLAAAQDDAMRGPRRGIEFVAIDSDGNGTLVRAELVARATSRLGAADANGDGALDRAEIVAVLPAPRNPLEQVFRQDPAEARADRMLAMMGATEAGRIEIAALAERHVNAALALLDSDHDGAISRQEADAMQTRRRGHHDGGDHHRGDRDRD